MIDYILVEKNPSRFLLDGVTPRAQESPYAISFERLGYKRFSQVPSTRSEVIPLLDGKYDIQHHGTLGHKYQVEGNFRLDNLTIIRGGVTHRSTREYVAELEARKPRWLTEHSILCTLIRHEDNLSTVELDSCYVSSGLRITMTGSIAGQPLLRNWSFELVELYVELNEAAIFDGSYILIPGGSTSFLDLVGPGVPDDDE